MKIPANSKCTLILRKNGGNLLSEDSKETKVPKGNKFLAHNSVETTLPRETIAWIQRIFADQLLGNQINQCK